MISELYWDGLLYPSLDMQRKMLTMHIDPTDNLVSDEDLRLMDIHLEKHMLEQGSLKANFSNLTFEAKLALYRNIVDGVVAMLVCYAGCRKTEIEAMEKVAWEDGLQHNPVRSMQNH